MLSDFLRRNWRWILGILASALLFIISPILFAVMLIIVVITYLLIRRYRRDGAKGGVAETKVRIVRSYGTISASGLRSGKVCFNVDFNNEVVRIGDSWISALSLSVLDSYLMQQVLGLAVMITDGNNHYLVVHGSDVNEVFIRINTIIEMLRSRNIPFKQLSSSEIVNEVVLRWTS